VTAAGDTVEPVPVGEHVAGDEAALPGHGPLEGRFIRAVPVEPDRHVEALFEGTHGSEAAEAVWTYLPYGPFASVAGMREWLASIANSSDPVFSTVVDVASGRPVGVVSYLNIVPLDRRIEIGHIWYVPDAQHGRANTETCYLLLRRAFDELGYRRVEWKCDALNTPSRVAAQRLGFVFEGVFRQHMIVKGRNRDTAWFSITDREWPARRDAMERWLDAEPGAVSLRAMTAEL
jgi:RimJ/RimL family protein N-acetyltransferase